MERNFRLPQFAVLFCSGTTLIFLGSVNPAPNPPRLRLGPDAFRYWDTGEIATLPSQGRAPGISCPTLSSPGAVPATTVKIKKKVIFKLPRGAAVPLWVYLKSSGQLQYIITNQQE